MKKPILTLVLLISAFSAFAKEKPKPKNESADSTEIMVEDIEKTLKYQTGDIVVGDNLAKLKVPAGFRFLDAPQAKYIIYDVWGNPKNEGENLYGLIVPEKIGVTEAGSWAFVIEYDDMGFVKDDDADKINYDDLMKEMNEGEAEANAERVKMGFSAVHIVGWAQKPYYDKDKKVLHWAKEIAFGGENEHTLNYNIRVLGRKGVLILNAVGGMDKLPEINEKIAAVLSSIEFNEGNKYADFNSSADKVAAWTIGGLVAGKVLAKVGLFAVILKFGKIIFIALAAAGGAAWRFLTGRGKEAEA